MEQRVQYLVEGLFKVHRDGFEASGFPCIPEGLDLLEEGDGFAVPFDLEDPPSIEQMLNVFKVDPQYEEHEKEYEVSLNTLSSCLWHSSHRCRPQLRSSCLLVQEMKKVWFGEDSDSAFESGSDESSDDEEEEKLPPPPSGGMAIQDQTDTNLINLRRTIYLTIMSSMDFEEAGHKLMKIELAPGQEMEIVTMLIECCSQEKTYLRWAESNSIEPLSA